MAQYPYWLTLTGNVANCYPGQVINLQTVGGTQPAYDLDIPVDPNTCTYLTTVGINSPMATWVMTSQCNGQVVSYADSAQYNFMGDSAYAVMNFNCGSNVVDCNGVVNGPDMPGTACDDGNPATGPDIWSSACTCVGQDTSGTWDCLQIWNGPNMPGTFCVNFLGDTGVWSVQCQCQTNTNVYDCLGVLNGPNMPGTACDDGDPMTAQDHWDANCACTGTQANNYDCLGVLGGNAIPGTACEGINSDSTGFYGTWDYLCVCQPDSNNTQVDCLGNPGGGALPGTPCTIPGTILEGIWSSNCVCEANNPEPCNADFWVIQAMGSDSLPIPYELWVWNLSSGNGNLQFLWNFGDGSTSTEAYPTHTYDGNGPYNLCLQIFDNGNCTSVHCDSISINGDGMYEGMIVHAEDRQEGFTINVQQGQSTAVQEVVTNSTIATWPNPAVDELNVAVVSAMKGNVTVTITDLDGRTVKTERTSLGGGRSKLRIATSGLNAGMYMLRISDGSVNVSQRFVKTN
jgi:hypothetical protein